MLCIRLACYFSHLNSICLDGCYLSCFFVYHPKTLARSFGWNLWFWCAIISKNMFRRLFLAAGKCDRERESAMNKSYICGKVQNSNAPPNFLNFDSNWSDICEAVVILALRALFNQKRAKSLPANYRSTSNAIFIAMPFFAHFNGSCRLCWLFCFQAFIQFRRPD